MFDEKLQFYSSVADEIAHQPLSVPVGCALLHLGPLARALRENARQWVTALGKQLNNVARESLTMLSAELQVRPYLLYPHRDRMR